MRECINRATQLFVISETFSPCLARLFFHERCARLIECLPPLQHHPNRPEDVLKVDAGEDVVGGDDAADCLRYLVATKERKVTQRKLRGL